VRPSILSTAHPTFWNRCILLPRTLGRCKGEEGVIVGEGVRQRRVQAPVMMHSCTMVCSGDCFFFHRHTNLGRALRMSTQVLVVILDHSWPNCMEEGISNGALTW
jgi:hypothetical protein